MNQAMEFHKLGIKAETERQILSDYAERYGLSDPHTVEQAENTQGMFDKLAALKRSILLPQSGVCASKGWVLDEQRKILSSGHKATAG